MAPPHELGSGGGASSAGCASSAGGEQPLLKELLFKHTVVGDYVVRRVAALYADRLETWPPGEQAGERHTYELQPGARLVPASRDDLARKKRHLRPRGVGSMTALAALRGQGEVLQLWTFRLEMSPSHWDFRFCFEEREQADRWHRALIGVITQLSRAPAAPAPAADGSSVHASSGAFARTSLPTLQSASSFVEEDEDAELARLMHIPEGAGSRRQQQRWVPWRHSNGLHIYQHHHGAAPPSGSGGAGGNGAAGAPDAEYTASAAVRGPPAAVLRALLDPSSCTTVLGPALDAEVVESSPGRQVLRVELAALGAPGRWFAPREALLQVLAKKDEDGVYVVMFSSVAGAASAAQQQQQQHEGVIETPEGAPVRRVPPVPCRVAGGYTISRLQGYSGADSPETLLTCVLQVQDMGGWLSPTRPLLRRATQWVWPGAHEAFLERMLLGVALVRDLVEKSRFAVKPQAYTLQEPRGGGAGAAPCGAPLWGDMQQQPSQVVPRTATFVLRQAAVDFGLSPPPTPLPSPFATEAGLPLAARSGSSLAARPAHNARLSRLASQRLPGSLSRSAGLRSLEEGGGSLAEGEEQRQPEFQLPSRYYQELHTPGTDAPFRVRGASYLDDGIKVQAGQPVFELLGVELVDAGGPQPCPHISRFLPSVRRSPKPFLFVYNLMVPGPPTICCVFVFGADSHPESLGPPPDDPEDCDWEPFDFLMWRFLNGGDEERRSLFKMIPHVAEGSWVIRQGVGTTPVIIGRKLDTSFWVTPKYVEVAVDVGSSTTAQYVTGMVRGGCRSLVIDLGLVLEGQNSWELPEALLGAVRVIRLDLDAASKLDDSREVPLLLTQQQQQQQQEVQGADGSGGGTSEAECATG